MVMQWTVNPPPMARLVRSQYSPPNNSPLMLTVAWRSPKPLVAVRICGGEPNNSKVAEWPNARDCKSLKPSVQIRPLLPIYPCRQTGKVTALRGRDL